MVAVVEVPVNGVWADVEIIVVCLIVIVLKFALPASYSTVDVPSDFAVDLFKHSASSLLVVCSFGTK